MTKTADSPYAWLVMNRFAKSEKFKELASALLRSARVAGLELKLCYNADLLTLFPLARGKKVGGRCDERASSDGVSARQQIDFAGDEDAHASLARPSVMSSTAPRILDWPPGLRRPDFVLFWDKDCRLADFLECYGLRLFNRAAAIRVCDDKALTYIRLSDVNLPMPCSYLAPLTFNPEGYPEDDMRESLEKIETALGFPLIIKECFGSFGRQVHLVRTHEECLRQMREIGGRPYIFQQFVATSSGRDCRIQILGDCVIAATERRNAADFRANVTYGGTMRLITPTAAQSAMARTACRALGLDFAGVDLLYGKDDAPLLCEVNSNAHFLHLEDATGVKVGDAIIRYCLDTIQTERMHKADII